MFFHSNVSHKFPKTFLILLVEVVELDEVVEDVVLVSDVVVVIARKINYFCSGRRTTVRNSIRSATRSNIRQAQYQLSL